MASDVYRLLDSIPDPILLVRTDGQIVYQNRATTDLIGRAIGIVPPAHNSCLSAALRQYLKRCSGSGQPVPGRIGLKSADGAVRHFRGYGNRVAADAEDDRILVLLRLSPPSDDRFAQLKRQIETLHAEIRRRRGIEARLQEALRDRDLLLGEIKHRIGNNFQMLLGMLSSARSSVADAESRAVLDRACRRIIAVNEAQRLLYGKALESVSTAELIGQLCRTTLEGTGSPYELALDVEPVEVPNDMVTPLVLIASELVTNAAKHAFLHRDTGRIAVTLRAVADELELTVADDGIGIDGVTHDQVGSGLAIVRGLVRQLGGTMEMHSTAGTTCRVCLRNWAGQPDAEAGGASAPASKS
jgi:two-component sensor histidine kinase